MSKKDYIKFAGLIRDRIQDLKGGYYAQWYNRVQELEMIVQDMIHIFEQDNSAFDRDRFLTACGFVYSEDAGDWIVKL